LRNLLILVPKEPWSPGGVERVVKETSKRLIDFYNVRIIAVGNETLQKVFNGVPVHIHKGLSEAYRFSPTLLFDIQKGIRPDIIHAHGFPNFMPLAASMAKKKLKYTKLIFHPHYHITGSTVIFNVMRRIYDETIGPHLIKNSDLIIANSRCERQLIRRRFKPAKPIFVVYNGVDVQKIREVKPFDIDDRCRVILYVGRLETYKNIHFTIAALKKLPKNYHFYLIGRGRNEYSLRKFVQYLHLSEKVHLLGFQSDENVYRWLKRADALVHLSSVESFGMTCIEALTAGTPVVVNNDNYGLKETSDLYPKEILVYESDKQSLSTLSNLIRKASEMKPIKVNTDSFSWNNISMQLHSLYSLV